MSAKLKVSVAFYLLFLNVTPVTVADILHPIEGGEIVARISRDGDTVILKTPMGQYRYPSSDFRSIISTRDPQKDWPNEQEAASAGSAVQCCETALWALDRGLISECDTMIREANRKDPTHQPSSRMVAVLDRLKAPCKDPDRSALLRNLPTDHRVAVGPHVLLFHQHSDQEASERLEILETVTKAYYLYFASIGIDLPPPKERLPSMWFAHKKEYLAFLRAEGATAFLTTRGFYQPTRRIVVAYDCRDDADRIKAKQESLDANAELDKFAAIAAKIPTKGQARVVFRGEVKTLDRKAAKLLEATLRHQLERGEIVRELSRREVDWGVAAHETIHQLVASSKLEPSGTAFPNSLREGLAMQFESIEAGRWAGLMPPSAIRLRDYRALDDAPKMIPTIRDIGFGPGYKGSDYAKAWALIYYLRVQKPKEFVALLDTLRAPNGDGVSAGIRASESLSKVLANDEDTRWRRFMKELPTAGVSAKQEK